jgi:hypothetical protein
MASRYRKIDPRIWTDERFRRLTAQEQRIALYILTAQSNRIGLFLFSPGKAVEDLGTLPPTFRKGFETVCQTLNWEWDAEARVIYLPTWWRYNQPENANNVIGNLKDLQDLPETPLLERFSSNAAYLSGDLIETFTQTLAKCYPQRSPKRSPSQEQEQEHKQKQEQDAPPAVDREFEEFWTLYPANNGKKVQKQEALRRFKRIKPQDRQLVLIAVRNYANSSRVSAGYIMDPHGWLKKGKVEPWRDWIEPEQVLPTNGHIDLQTCAKRIQAPGDRFLHECGKPASPQSRPAEPRCADHLMPIQNLEGVAAC